MAFTSHGHLIPNSPLPETEDQFPQTVARCGGPDRCVECARETLNWKSWQFATTKKEYISHELLQYFAFEHLPKALQVVSQPFHKLAEDLDYTLDDGSQKDLALTHLLQAKDAAVRSHVTWLKREGRPL